MSAVKLTNATESLLASSGVNDSKKLQFRKDCVTLLVVMVAKLQEQNPLKYQIVCCMTCFWFRKILSTKKMNAFSNLKKLWTNCVQGNTYQLRKQMMLNYSSRNLLRTLLKFMKMNFCHSLSVQIVLTVFTQSDCIVTINLKAYGKL